MKPRLLPTLIALLLTSAVASAAAITDAEKRLHEAVGEVIVIADRSRDRDTLAKGVRPVLEKYLSFEAMTRRAIGPGWRQFTPEQQRRAIELFSTLIIRTYCGKFTPGEHPLITFKAASTPAPGRVEIPTTLVYQGSRYTVVYRMEEIGGWRITDIVAEGVSLIANYRSQFDAQFQKGGPNAVLNSLSEAVSHPQ